MTRGVRWTSAALAVLAVAAPLAAQAQTDTRHALLFGAYGGGYKPIMDLAGIDGAYFAPGASYGATVGYEINRMWAVHADFTYTRSQAEGNASFTGMLFDRFFYGAHAEVGYDLGSVAPYLFFGGGAVTIDEVGSDATLQTFTRPAGMFGAGMFWALGRSNLGLFAEMKNLVYNWDRGGPSPGQWYIPSTGGGIYTVETDAGQFDSMQWDFTYTVGVSYRLPLGARHAQPHPPAGE